MQRLYSWLKNLSAAKQFFLARTTYDWAIYVFDTFYMTTVFKESGEVKEVVLNIIVTLLTIYVGFLLGSIFLKRLGAEVNLKLSFVMYLITGIVGVYLSQLGIVSFLLISSIRGISEGFYWVSANFVELVGVPHDSRSKIYSIFQSSYGVFTLVAPVILGYLLTTFNTFLPIYVIFCLFWIVGLLIPFNFKVNNKISFSFLKFQQILRHPQIVSYTILKFMQSTMWMLDWFTYALIPYLVLGSEFNMGILLTVSALVQIAVSFFTRNLAVKNKSEWGGGLIAVSGVFTALFAFNFTTFFLYLSNIVSNITGSVATPAEFDLGMRATNKIEEGKDIGNELNLYQESVFTVARILLAVLLFWGGSVLEKETLLVSCLLIWLFLRMACYWLSFQIVQPHKQYGA